MASHITLAQTYSCKLFQLATSNCGLVHPCARNAPPVSNDLLLFAYSICFLLLIQTVSATGFLPPGILLKLSMHFLGLACGVIIVIPDQVI